MSLRKVLFLILIVVRAYELSVVMPVYSAVVYLTGRLIEVLFESEKIFE